MRHGFTTGSCAAAAAKAAAYMLLLGIKKEKISITTPHGEIYEPEIIEAHFDETRASCAVVKDGGDDPDVTSGALIFAEVIMKAADNGNENANIVADNGKDKDNQLNVIADSGRDANKMPSVVADGGEDTENKPRIIAYNGGNTDNKLHIIIDGGKGVGRVTRPGLDQSVGSAAINSVPRKMIENEVSEVCEAADFHGELLVTISVPDGEKIAVRTFNPRLGIEGGISIIGTSGIVEPMSRKAIIETIRVELRQKRQEGNICAAVSPGNYGLAFMKERYGYDIDKSVKCSNFIGQTVDMAAELGFESILITGNMGKLVKVAGGIMDTHSREADCRMEILASSALRAGADAKTALEILDCVVTDEALDIMQRDGVIEGAMEELSKRIGYYLDKRGNGKIETEFVVYSNKFGELIKSKGADKWLILLAQDQARQI